MISRSHQSDGEAADRDFPVDRPRHSGMLDVDDTRDFLKRE